VKQGVCLGCSLPPLLFVLYMNDMIRKWRLTSHSSMTINRNLELDTTFCNWQG